MNEFSVGAIPAAVRDGDEYELVLATSGITLRALLALVSRKTEEVRRRRPFNTEALAGLQKRLSSIFTWDTCHVEGNTVPLSETLILLESGVVYGGGHRLVEYTELVATRDAIVTLLRTEPWRELHSAASVLSLVRSLHMHTSLKATMDAELGRFVNVLCHFSECTT